MMRKSLFVGLILLGLMMLGSTPQVEAQFIIQLGSGTLVNSEYNPSPVNIWYRSTRLQILYTKEELNAAGVSGPAKLNALGWWIEQRPAYDLPDYTIRLKNTTAVGASVHDEVGLIEVYKNPLYSPTQGGWQMLQFNVGNFEWDGTSNILVDVCWDIVNPTYNASGRSRIYDPSPVNSMSYAWSDGSSRCPFATSYYSGYNLKPQVQMDFAPVGIEASFPDDVDPRKILRSGNIYNTAPNRPFVTFRATAGTPVNITFKLIGPLPSQNVIYEARSNGSSTIVINPNVSGNMTYYFNEATGPAAGVSGALNLTGIAGGAYRVIGTYETPSSGLRPYAKDFLIAFPNDLSVREITAPFTQPFKYPLNIQIPVLAKFQNVGLNTVTKFNVSASIFRGSSNIPIYQDSESISGVNLATGDIYSFSFASFTGGNIAGEYRVEICSELVQVRNENGQLVNVQDQQAANNCLPQPGQVYTFEVQYEQEIAATGILHPAPGNSFCSNRPILPEGVFTNLGISDASNIPVLLSIYRIVNGVRQMPAAYVDAEEVPNLPIGNVEIGQLFDHFIPRVPGIYEAELRVNLAVPDPVTGNDVVTSTFEVTPQLAGEYSVGLGYDFSTISEAIDALYACGISGPVTFLLMDANYVEGTMSQPVAALDLTGGIIGVSEVNTITWKPSVNRAVDKASVNITLRSAAGIGIMFGQSTTPGNPNAAILEFPTEKQYANPSGYMFFDGGENKSIRFRLESNSAQRAVFYFGRGAANYAVRNCVIENHPNSNPSYTVSLPQQRWEQGDFKISYEPDVRVISNDVFTYSAGIVIRNTVPVDRLGSNPQNLDTIGNSNNWIVNNEISHFGYGIVSLGNGVLFTGSELPRFQRFYNMGNRIIGNKIWNVARAGIFLGYEENAVISSNRIYNVGSAVGYSGRVAGIAAGGDGRYNNVGLTISANEISAVSADSYVAGIVVNQALNEFTTPGGSPVVFPSGNTAQKVYNNNVWGLNRATNFTTLAGIHFLTERNPNATGLNALLQPRIGSYNTIGDFIANNTVIIENDNVSGSAPVFAIGIQHARDAKVYNNAVAMLGGSNTSDVFHTALFYQGIDARMEGGLVSDRNAYHTPNASMAYMVETTENNTIIDFGSQNMFRTLQQWVALSEQDNNSVTGNFYADMHKTGSAPYVLRVKTNPAPLGSILNNRGLNLLSIATDVEGQIRGSAEQRYDIGADEFNGRSYLNDVEAVTITSPRSYKRYEGTFSDAEYINGRAPISVTALIRNNGSLPSSGLRVTAKISREVAPGSMAEQGNYSAPILSQVQLVDIPEGETVEVTFDFEEQFNPQTYGELGNYNVPAMFQPMARNVTPRYRIEVSTVSDQNIANNTAGKQVRFHVYRANTGILLSTKHSSVNNLVNESQIAGNTDADSLVAAMNDLNWFYASNNKPGTNDFDVLARESWEPYSVKYDEYNVLVFAGDNDAFTRLERQNIRDFIELGKEAAKKNVIVIDENVAKNHIGTDVINDQYFVNRILRAQWVNPPGTPFTPNYDGKYIQGNSVGKQYREKVSATGVAGDADPIPALIKPYSDQQTGVDKVTSAYTFESFNGTGTERGMGTAVAGIQHNLVFYSIDFRHVGRLEQDMQRSGGHRLIRAAMDYFAQNDGSLLPVELSAFDAYKLDSRSVEVAWETKSEQNSDRFEIERREIDAIAFEKLGEVQAQNNSSSTVDYNFVDNQVQNDNIYVYRLRMVDLDGSYAFSGEVQVDMRDFVAGGADLWLGPSAPNPASVSVEVTVNASAAQNATLQLFDAQGKLLRTLWNGSLAEGKNTITADVSDLASGTYHYVLSSGDQKLSKQLKVVR